MKVSVIIPVFKVARFVERCTRSLMEQTLKEVEFIFVDDASPDESVDIIRRVTTEYNRDVKFLKHEVNKGLPSGRNTGLGVAQGEYIFHCDSDDWVEKDMLELMYNTAKEHNADIAYCDFYMSFEKSERYMGNPTFESAEKMLKEGFLAGTMKYNVWNKIAKRSLYVENDITFPDGHSMGEDMTMIPLAAVADKVCYIPKALYHYIKTNPSAYSQTLSQKYLDDIQYNVARVEKSLEEISQNREIKELDKYMGFFKLNIKLPFLLSQDNNQLKLWKEWYPEANKHIAENKFLPFRTRFVQQLAAKKQFWAVKFYSFAVNNLFYKLLYR